MPWNMLNNGVCPPEPPSPLRFVKISSGTYVNMAIDSLGRLYAWGSSSYMYQGQTPVPVPDTLNFTRHPATFRASPYYAAMVYPYQTGYPKSDWVDCQTWEYVHMALDADGFIYAVGEDGTGSTVYGRGGWGPISQYREELSHVFTPGDSQAITFQLVNNHQWSNFVLGGYHVIAQKLDKSLWIWGTNLSNATYGNLAYANDFMSLIPIQMTWVPGPVKCFDCSYSVTVVVTESNEIYQWGAWGNSMYLTQEPTQIPFALSSGITITDVKCNASGIIILLSNGDVYGIGEYMGGTQPDEALSFTKLSGNHIFTKIFAAKETGAAALDNSGVIWAWGNQSFLIVQGGVDDIVTGTPTFTSGPDPNVYRWIDFAPGSWSYLAINDEGRLFSWGTNVYGLPGIGLFETDPTSDDLYSAVECGPFATLENGVNAYESYEPGAGTAALQYEITSPAQLAEHNPCGHWHKKLDTPGESNIDEIPFCCWSFSLAISGADIVLYGLGIKPTCPIIGLRYNIATRVWSRPFSRVDNFFAAQYLSGAYIDGHLTGVIAYGGDGDQVSSSNHRVRVLVTNHTNGELADAEFLGTPPQTCEGRLVINSAFNLVAIIIQKSASLELWSSDIGGGLFYLQKTWIFTGVFKQARIVRTSLYYFVGIMYDNNEIEIHRSEILVDWTVQTAVSVSATAGTFNMWVDSETIYILCHETLFYSTDNGITFTGKSVTNPTNFGVANGITKQALIFYPNLIEKTLDYSITNPTWNELPVIPGIDYALNSLTTIRNSGDYVAYITDNLFVDSRIVLPISQTLGNDWEIVQSPLTYFESTEAALNGVDNPRWKFAPSVEKIRLDPQYI